MSENVLGTTLTAKYIFSQALSKHLKRTRYAYLGFPYWDWTKNSTVPTLFDGLKYPNIFDRMIDLKRGGKKKSIQVCMHLKIGFNCQMNETLPESLGYHSF